MNEQNQSNENIQAMQKPKRKKRRVLKIISIILVAILVCIGVGLGIYAYHNMHDGDHLLDKVYEAGYKEKQAKLYNGSIINYVESPDNKKIPLLLIHGQSMEWKDYAKVLPELSKQYHVYAVDCYGHGKSSHNPSQYTCTAMGKDFIWFIENVIHQKCVVSGHSSGGILTAWIAANAPKDVRGIVLEDPPFFCVEPDEVKRQKAFVYYDAYEVGNSFIKQKEEKDYVVYYMEHSYLYGQFGNLHDVIVNSTKKYRASHPGEPLKIWYLPFKLTYGTWFYDDFDVKFGVSFSNGSWFNGINQEKILTSIQCPSVYIKAPASYGKDGVLFAASTDKDGEKVHALIKGNKMVKTEDSSHDVHLMHPEEFIKIMADFSKVVSN